MAGTGKLTRVSTAGSMVGGCHTGRGVEGRPTATWLTELYSPLAHRSTVLRLAEEEGPQTASNADHRMGLSAPTEHQATCISLGARDARASLASASLCHPGQPHILSKL